MNSVQSQKGVEIEHIFMDGQSNDGTIDYIKSCKKKPDILNVEKDKGLYDALNKGINLASGKYIGLLHSDDYYASDRTIKKIENAFDNNDTNVIYANLNYVNGQHKIIRKWKSQSFSSQLIRNGWMPPHPTVFIKRDFLIKLGQFNLCYKISSDYDFLIRMMLHKNFKPFFLDELVCNMAVGGMSNSGLKNLVLKSFEDYKIMKSYGLNPVRGLFFKLSSKIVQFR
jgi:glycosyltransferase